MVDRNEGDSTTFLNPVYPNSFPDPFVLKHGGEYFAYSTGFANDGTVFPVIRSCDLVNWCEIGGAMHPLEHSPPHYWAPEVTYDNGKFYLYYSVGNETFMELRVAVSDKPDSGFADSGVRLTKEDFAIDAHVFIDDDGAKYLFYATDFLTYSHIGTGTVVDRMIDWFTLEGNPRPITRAKYDWQVYDPHRKEKGGVRWHTVEGPAVVKRKGRYYEMFSGGNWQNVSYGVSFAISDSLDTRDEWLQFSDGVNTLPILRTIPNLVVGPGHNCIVRGPNNRELYCVYHRWTEAGRVMAIDRMDFAGERIFVTGATHTRQPLPYSPTVDERFLHEHSRVSSDMGMAVPASFLLEITWTFTEESSVDSFEIEFATDEGSINVAVDPVGLTLESPGNEPVKIPMPSGFALPADHLLRFEAHHTRFDVTVDSIPKMALKLGARLERMTTFGNGNTVRIKRFQLTEGFEELFDDDTDLLATGWNVTGGTYAIADGELQVDPAEAFLIQRENNSDNFEFAANIRTADANLQRGEVGLVLFHDESEEFKLTLNCETLHVISAGTSMALPDNIAVSQYHQLRVVKLNGTIQCYFDDVRVGETASVSVPAAIGLFASGVSVAIEMIRVTSI